VLKINTAVRELAESALLAASGISLLHFVIQLRMNLASHRG
jgi:hypothetical protein